MPAPARSELTEPVKDDKNVSASRSPSQPTDLGRKSDASNRDGARESTQKLPTRCVGSTDHLVKAVQLLVGKQGTFKIEVSRPLERMLQDWTRNVLTRGMSRRQNKQMRNSSYIVKSSTEIELVRSSFPLPSPRPEHGVDDVGVFVRTQKALLDLVALGSELEGGLDANPEHRMLVGQDRRSSEEMGAGELRA